MLATVDFGIFYLPSAVGHVMTKIYKTIILPVVLYGCQTSYVTLRKEHRLRNFENRALKIIFRPMRGGMTGNW
jgi:hypothetical protein